ncbi:hypothetical protein AC578_10231 [Pseudocercospora eumusae]|uniref:Uncharacterized protein n=1 Tax=Pseudocercospora eumusae TaxID=321146 RepID=A0A139HYN0_9PEZI|nr:hypothetical protein AC578_10231 [Pseudocercospora eumusae]
MSAENLFPFAGRIHATVQVPAADTDRWTEKLLELRHVLYRIHTSAISSPAQLEISKPSSGQYARVLALLICIANSERTLGYFRDCMESDDLVAATFECLRLLEGARVAVRSPFDAAFMLVQEVREARKFLKEEYVFDGAEDAKCLDGVQLRLHEMVLGEGSVWPEEFRCPFHSAIEEHIRRHGWDARMQQLVDAAEGPIQGMLFRLKQGAEVEAR